MAWSNVFVVFDVIKKVLPLMLGLMQIAEESGATGEVKKASVLEIIKGAVATATSVATGGAKESWALLEKPFGAMVDLFAVMFFGSKPAIKVDWFEDEDHAN